MKNIKERTFSWLHHNLEVKDVEYGRGVFANAPFKKDELLMMFGGYILTRNEEEKLPEEIRDVAIQVAPDFVLGIINTGELSYTDCVNHSCSPNSGIRGQISLVAMRDIQKGEEITFDYGTVLYRIDGAPEYKLECLCGSTNCRKVITQSDWKIPELQQRYKGYFPYYIEDSIRDMNK